jgi:hypothetical protein
MLKLSILLKQNFLCCDAKGLVPEQNYGYLFSKIPDNIQEEALRLPMWHNQTVTRIGGK